jgi:hypothetical protein
MRPIRRAPKPVHTPAGEEVREAEESGGGSKILVISMVVFLGISFLFLGAALAVLELPDSRFHIDRPWFDSAFSGFMGLSTICAAASLLMKLVIQLSRRY